MIFGLLAGTLARLLRSSWEPQLLPAGLRGLDGTLSRLRAQEYDRPCDPVDGDPGAVFEDDPHPRSSAGCLLEPRVCHHTREPTVLSRLSCRPSHLNVDRFHQPCLLPGRTSRIGGACRFLVPRPLTLAGSPVLPPLRLTGGFCHAD